MTDFQFLDTETRSTLDVKTVGAHKYADHPDTTITVICHAPDDDWPRIWSPEWAWGNSIHSTYDEYEPTELLDHIEDGGYIVAWNAAFDRLVFNKVAIERDWPLIQIKQTLCAQAQAEANNLPGALGKAADCLGTYHKKDPKGSKLISLLANGTIEDWNSEEFETPELMGHFRAYCMHDVTAMRDIWQHTRPLTTYEWDEYHASERINDRGVMVDVEFAEHARNYANAETRDISQRLVELTGDEKMTINAHLRKADFLHSLLQQDEDLQRITERPPKKKNDPPRKSCDRPTREAVLEALANPERGDNIDQDRRETAIEFIELIEAGNGAAVRKFNAIVNQAVDERVYGSYSFNGAGQTGRFSSRGIQVHNIIRAPLEKDNPNRALDAIDDIVDGMPAFKLEEKYGLPVSRLLARLIRPTFIAPEGKTLVWADWDQIEARVLPWLANTPGADAKLDLFREGEDVYRHAASAIFGKWIDDIDENERQVGKVSELALGFGGAVGAFSAMGRGYGISVPEAQVKQIVNNWRFSNGWCVSFWHELWQAALSAFNDPGTWYHVGRVKYLYHPGLMRGTLICQLPDGRWLVYPQFIHERVIVEDEDGNTEIKWSTTYMKAFGGGFGRSELWYGILAENITQAVAASFLRRALVFNQENAVLHTHDEIVLEVPEHQADDFAIGLEATMTDIPDWAEGLPLTISVESGPFYSK